jgi:C1A family cysteine protease
MRFATVGLAMLLAQTNAIEDIEKRFVDYVARHGKSYDTKEEFEFRLNHFKTADEFIQEHNSSNGSFTVGHNMFSDMTTAEKQHYKGKVSFGTNVDHVEQEVIEDFEVDAEVDWRGVALGGVRNQGHCGSCWTFSGTGVIEAAHYFKTGEIIDLAEQQIVDCQTEWDGCNGGMERDAIAYGQNHGICYESQYPYTATDGNCQHPSCDTGVGIATITDVKPRSQSALQQALMQSPTTLAVDAECDQFYYYTGGILDSCCGT